MALASSQGQDFGFGAWETMLMSQSHSKQATAATGTSSPGTSPSKRLGKRLAKVTIMAHDQSSGLFNNKGDIFLINQERQTERHETHKSNLDMIKMAVSKGVKAPGLEKTKSVKARLREIDAAAQINASELSDRQNFLSKAKTRRDSQSLAESESRLHSSLLDHSFSESMLSGPMFKTEAELECDRRAALPAVAGPGATERMAKAVTQAKQLFEKQGILAQTDLAWAERRLQQERAREESGGGQQSLRQSLPQQASGLEVTALEAMARSASAPTLGVMTSSSTGVLPLPWPGRGPPRRRPRLQHDVLYPSMNARCRVVEHHARQNATTISGLAAARLAATRVD